MSELTSDDDEETANLASISFSSCALSFALNRKGVIMCVFKATCSLVSTGLTPMVSGASKGTLGDAKCVTEKTRKLGQQY